MTIKKGKQLTTVVPAIAPDVLAKLAAYWITTAEELLGAAVEEGGMPGLVAVTGLTQDAVVQLVTRVQSAMPVSISFAPGGARRHGMGALVDPNPPAAPSTQIAQSAPKAPLPSSVDLHDRFGPVRDQGSRGTCVAHACAALREYLTGAQSTSSDLSEQFLYWDCKKHDMMPGEGTFVRVGMSRLQVDGICTESDWPYNPNPIPGNESQDPAPAGILTKAGPNRIASNSSLTPTDVDGLRQALANGSPIAIAVPVYTHWFTEPTNTTGDIRIPLPGEKMEGGHAMCITGYQSDPAVPGGGYFSVRNSWGAGWASQSAVAPGYARIPFAFLNRYANSAYTGAAGPVPTPDPTPVQPKSIWDIILDFIRSLFG